MSDFFLRLAARSLDSTPVALPRIASRYATPGWDRSPQVDAQFAAGAASEPPPPAPAAVAARSRENGEVVDASPPPTSVSDDGPATPSPSASQVFAVDAEYTARRTSPHTPASVEAPSGSHARVGSIESGREAAAIDPERSRQFPRAPLTAITAADQIDRSPEAYGPIASTREAGMAPTAPAHASRPRDDATNASSDIVRVTPPDSDEALAGPARVGPGVAEHARSRPTTADLVRTTPDTPPAPEIHVSIGRIEVRAVMPPALPTPRPRASAIGPALSLEAYLRQRQEGSR
jgi:hypothetical protein